MADSKSTSQGHAQLQARIDALESQLRQQSTQSAQAVCDLLQLVWLAGHIERDPANSSQSITHAMRLRYGATMIAEGLICQIDNAGHGSILDKAAEGARGLRAFNATTHALRH
jgi:hypothetical protein